MYPRVFYIIALAEWTGLEPATPGVTGRYSNQLNYHSSVVPSARYLFCRALTASSIFCTERIL